VFFHLVVGHFVFQLSFVFSSIFCMFLHVFYMILHVSACFCMFLFPVRLSLVLGRGQTYVLKIQCTTSLCSKCDFSLDAMERCSSSHTEFSSIFIDFDLCYLPLLQSQLADHMPSLLLSGGREAGPNFGG
jgi:hypothetical protein